MEASSRLKRGSIRALASAIPLSLALVAGAPAAWAHGPEAHAVKIGFDEKLGSYAALDLPFTGEDGKTVRLRELVTAPTILVLVYYRCKDQCSTQLIGLAAALRRLDAAPGTDYRVVTASINPAETPTDAAEKKAIALAAVERPFPPEAWRFLVGADASIDALADSVGFSFVKRGEDYDHPLGLVLLSPSGKVVRYMTGTDFLPLDLGMSLMEASKGVARPTIAKMLRFCYSFDPGTGRFGFNVLRVSGIAIGTLVLGLALFLVLSGRRPRKAAAKGGSR